MTIYSSEMILVMIAPVCLLKSQLVLSAELASEACIPSRKRVTFYEQSNYREKCVVLKFFDYENSAKLDIDNYSISTAKITLDVMGTSYLQNNLFGRVSHHVKSECASLKFKSTDKSQIFKARYEVGDNSSSIVALFYLTLFELGRRSQRLDWLRQSQDMRAGKFSVKLHRYSL